MITAHDVRRLHVCSLCGELGIHKPVRSQTFIGLVICTNTFRAPGRVADYQHPTCYAGASVTKLMILPREERDFIRICDVTTEQMKGLLAAAEDEDSRK